MRANYIAGAKISDLQVLYFLRAKTARNCLVLAKTVWPPFIRLVGTIETSSEYSRIEH